MKKRYNSKNLKNEAALQHITWVFFVYKATACNDNNFIDDFNDFDNPSGLEDTNADGVNGNWTQRQGG